MFNSEHRKAKKEIEQLLDNLQMNLENNYKDLAISSRKEAFEKLEQLKDKLTDKDYKKLSSRLMEYSKKMEGYSHRLNVKF